jgi:hypothetical protein
MRGAYAGQSITSHDTLKVVEELHHYFRGIPMDSKRAVQTSSTPATISLPRQSYVIDSKNHLDGLSGKLNGTRTDKQRL